jgi:acyl carrier protein
MNAESARHLRLVEDLQMDSFDIFGMILEMEDTLGIELDPQVIIDGPMETVGDVLSLVNRKPETV